TGVADRPARVAGNVQVDPEESRPAGAVEAPRRSGLAEVAAEVLAEDKGTQVALAFDLGRGSTSGVAGERVGGVHEFPPLCRVAYDTEAEWPWGHHSRSSKWVPFVEGRSISCLWVSPGVPEGSESPPGAGKLPGSPLPPSFGS